MRPTLSAEFVLWKMRIPAPAMSSASPMVDTNWPVHSSVKLRRRKTANADGCASGSAEAIAFPSCQMVGEPRPIGGV